MKLQAEKTFTDTLPLSRYTPWELAWLAKDLYEAELTELYEEVKREYNNRFGFPVKSPVLVGVEVEE